MIRSVNMINFFHIHLENIEPINYKISLLIIFFVINNNTAMIV